MNVKKGFIKAMLCTFILAITSSCATVFDVVFVNAGITSSNQTINSEYSPDVESSVPLKTSAENSAEIESVNASSVPFGGESQDAILGYFAGVGANIPLNPNLSARTEMRFSKKGSKTEINNIASNTTRLSYIDIPLILQYQIVPKLSIQGGLQPSFLLSANMESEVNGESSDRSVRDIYNGFDLAATLGVSYNINKNLSVQLGYDLGLLNVERQADFREVGNRAIWFGLQYNLKKW